MTSLAGAPWRRGLTGLMISTSLLLGACSMINDRIDRPDAPEARMAMQVKAALMKDEDIDAAPIRVRVEDGQVILEGFVDDLGASQQAESVARRIAGDRTIVNRLVQRRARP